MNLADMTSLNDKFTTLKKSSYIYCCYLPIVDLPLIVTARFMLL